MTLSELAWIGFSVLFVAFVLVSLGWFLVVVPVVFIQELFAEPIDRWKKRHVTGKPICRLCGNGPDDDSSNDACLQGEPYGPMHNTPNGVECNPCFLASQEN